MRRARPALATEAAIGRCEQCPYLDPWEGSQAGELPQEMHACEDPEMCELCFQDHLDSHDSAFYRRYPTRESFAADGAGALLWFEDFDPGCQQAWLRAEGSGLVRENRFYLPYYFTEIIHTGLLNAGYREREWTHPCVGRAVRALEAFGGRRGALASAKVFTEPSSNIFPRFGFALDVRLPEEIRWERVLDWDEDGPEEQTLQLVNPWHDRQDEAWEELRALCQEHGLAQFVCQACGQPLTDQYPDWPGVWVAFGEEDGPNCRESANGFGLEMPESYDRPSMPSPHRPLAESGAPVHPARSGSTAPGPGSRVRALPLAGAVHETVGS